MWFEFQLCDHACPKGFGKGPLFLKKDALSLIFLLSLLFSHRGLKHECKAKSYVTVPQHRCNWLIIFSMCII